MSRLQFFNIVRFGFFIFIVNSALANSEFKKGLSDSNFQLISLGEFTQEQTKVIKKQIQIDNISLEEIAPTLCGFKIFKILYKTTDVNGKLTIASGLVAIPFGSQKRSIVSYQHGTSTDRSDVPSRLLKSQEAKFTTTLFGGACHIVVEADYLGLGDNINFHPYFHAKTEASATEDLLRTVIKNSKKIGFNWNQQLFLAGYSQGGHSTMALQRSLEKSNDLSVTASAPMAGPYDLSGTTLMSSLQNHTDLTSFLAADIVYSYHKIYNTPGSYSDFVVKPYDDKIDTLFDGAHSIGDIIKNLPEDPKQLFTSSFQSDIIDQKNTLFVQALRKNNVYEWVPRGPMKLFHGEKDLDSPFENSRKAYNYMVFHGAKQVELVSLGQVDHGGGFVPALIQANIWFNKF